MKLQLKHRLSVHQVTKVARHPWTRRAVVTAGVLVVLASLGWQGPAFAANQTKTVTTQADFQAGTSTNIDTESVPDSIQLTGSGSWSGSFTGNAPKTLNTGSQQVSDGTNLYLTSGGGHTNFYSYNQASGWTALANTPYTQYTGTSLAYDGSGTIYATLGNFNNFFAKYTIATNTWTTLATTPGVTGYGASLADDGTYLYLLTGNTGNVSGNDYGFYRYDPGANTWSLLPSTTQPVSNGGSMVYSSGILYVTPGLNSSYFLKYTISSRVWSSLANTPGNIGNGYSGGSTGSNGTMAAVGGNIYKFSPVGGNSSLYKYNISGNSWSTVVSSAIYANEGSSIAYVSATGYLYISQGNNNESITVFNTATDTILTLATPAPQDHGSQLISDGSRYFYFVQGGYGNGFYQYDTTTNAWATLANTPFAIGNNADSNGVYIGGYVYTEGNGAALGRYSVSGNSWTTLTSAPNSIASLGYPGSGNYIYAQQWQGKAFYEYSISGNSWTTLTSLPSTPQNFSNLSSASRLASDGTYIYEMLGGGSNDFLRYSISGNSWTEMTSAPFPSNEGSSLTYYSSNLYATAGDNLDDFYQYNISANSWQRLPDLFKNTIDGSSCNDGCDLSVMGSSIYYIPGWIRTGTAGQGANGGRYGMFVFTPGSTTYASTGTWVSPTYDFTYVSAWVSLASTTTTGSDSSLTIETRSSADGVSWSSWQALSSGNIQSPTNRYLQVEAVLDSSTDGTVTPTLADFTVTYTGDTTAPTNPSTINGYSSNGGTALTSGNSYSYPAPYFTWSGASDGQTGLKGYDVYFGTNGSADPATAGSFSSSTNYTVNTPMTAGTYYLRVKAVDNAGNTASSAWSAFTYIYNGIGSAAKTITSQSDFTTGSTLSNVSATQSSGDLQLSSAPGFWEQNSLTAGPGLTCNYNDSPAQGAYVASSNTIYSLVGCNGTALYSYSVTSNTWTSLTASPFGVQSGGGLVGGPSGYLYGWVGNNSAFMKYDIAGNSWDYADIASLPFGNAGTETAAIFDGSHYIYMSGSGTSFYRYDTSTNSWARLANVNFGNGNPYSDNNFDQDTRLAYDGSDTIYALQGGYNQFAKYSIANNTWTVLSPTLTVSAAGTTLTYDGTTGDLYSVAGNSGSSKSFLQYNVATNTWSKLANTPVAAYYGAQQYLIGSLLYTYLGVNDSGQLEIFDVNRGVWDKPIQNVFGPDFNGLPTFPIGQGAGFIQGDSGNYYGMQGNYGAGFVRYSPSTGIVTALASSPFGFLNGVSGVTLAYDTGNNTIYALSGISFYGVALHFFAYSIASNTWSQVDSGTNDLLPEQPRNSASIVSDGTYVDYFPGAGSGDVWRFNPSASAGSRWTEVTVNTAPGFNAGASATYYNGKIYAFTGNNAKNFYVTSTPAGGSWSSLANLPINASNTSYITSGGDGYLYAYIVSSSCGSNGGCQQWYRYSISGNSWAQLANTPVPGNYGVALAGGNGNFIYGFLGNGASNIFNGNSLYTYVIQTSTTSFSQTGTYTSGANDLTNTYGWANLTADYTTPANTSVQIATQSSPDGSSWSGWAAVTNEQIVGNNHTYQIASPVNRYIEVQVTLNSDGVYTPTFNDYTVNYYSDTTPPVNPSAVTAYDSSGHNSTLTTATWYNYGTPQFVWPVANATNGATDTNGSGVNGYYVYFGTDNSADPTITSGIINAGSAVQYQTGTTLTLASTMTSGQTYYLLIKTKDNAGNITSGAYNAFAYKFDSVAPTNPASITTSPAGYSADDNFTFSWSAASDSSSGLAKYQYRTGGDGSSSWTDLGSGVTTVTLPNVNHTQGEYQDGTNTFYLRAVDNAGNASAPILTSYYFSGTDPTPPQDLAITPSSNTVNSFTASWSPPASYVGDPSALTYHWSVNVVPSPSNTVSTSSTSVGPAALATAQGTNTFYVVAEDGSGNIDYSLYASATFSASVTAPSVPNQFTASDTSNRTSGQYSAALSWNVPTDYDPDNFAGYHIYRSLDGVSFSLLASTTSTAYVDQNLSNTQTYYYYATAYTKNGVESADTSTESLIPTGRFTQPPTIDNSSVKSTTSSDSATFTWLTTRADGDPSATSFAKCGLTVAKLTFSGGDFDQTITHSATITGLSPSTTYQCFIYATDIDGNTAQNGPIAVSTIAPPAVTNINVSDIGLTSARVSFTTSVEATGTLEYGLTPTLGTSVALPGQATSFSVPISSLNDGTNYFYGFNMTSDTGETFGQSVISSFSTLPEPVITNVQAQLVTGVFAPTFEVTYNTNVPANTSLLYSSQGVSQQEAADSTLVINHSIQVPNLAAFTDYTIVVNAKDGYGNAAASQTVHVTTKGSTKPPTVLSAAFDALPQTNGRTNIVARVETDEPSSGQIEVAPGINNTNFNLSSGPDAFNQNHSLSLTVNAGTVYSIRVKLTDSSGNVSYTKTVNISTGISKLTPAQLILNSLQQSFGWLAGFKL